MKYLQDTLREEFGKRSIADIEMPKYFATSLNPMMKLRPYQEECFKYFIMLLRLIELVIYLLIVFTDAKLCIVNLGIWNIKQVLI